MSKELDLLSVLKNRDNYQAFSQYVDTNSLSDMARVVVKAMGEYLDSKATLSEVDWGKFRTWFMVIHKPKGSTAQKELYGRLFDALEKHETDEDFEEELLTHFITQDVCSNVVDHIVRNDGVYDLESIQEMIDAGVERLKAKEEEAEDDVPLEDLVSRLVTTGGYDLRLEGYSVSIGKVRPGDMIVVAGRPESGKTSHVIDQFVRPVIESEDDAVCLFFNNEEDGDKIRMRAYQCVLGKSGVDIARDVLKSSTDYKAKVGKRFIVKDEPGMSTGYVEKQCKKHKPKVIVFNVLDKVYGFTKTSSNDVDRVRKLAQWARRLAKEYDAVVVCVCQADGSVEGERWFGQDKVYGSKTGIPGEADVLICLGHSHDDKDKDHRFLTIAKNKTTGTSTTDPDKSHHKFVCGFEPSTGRFTDVR